MAIGNASKANRTARVVHSPVVPCFEPALSLRGACGCAVCCYKHTAINTEKKCMPPALLPSAIRMIYSLPSGIKLLGPEPRRGSDAAETEPDIAR